MQGVLAGMWYLHPGSKSFSDRSTGGFIPWYLVLSFHHSALQFASVMTPLNTFHRHWSIIYPNGRKAILRSAIFIRAFMSDSEKEIKKQRKMKRKNIAVEFPSLSKWRNLSVRLQGNNRRKICYLFPGQRFFFCTLFSMICLSLLVYAKEQS